MSNYLKAGEQLRHVRESVGLNKRKFAINAGVDPSQYVKIEKDELPITENIIDKLSKTYDLVFRITIKVEKIKI